MCRRGAVFAKRLLLLFLLLLNYYDETCNWNLDNFSLSIFEMFVR